MCINGFSMPPCASARVQGRKEGSVWQGLRTPMPIICRPTAIIVHRAMTLTRDPICAEFTTIW